MSRLVRAALGFPNRSGPRFPTRLGLGLVLSILVPDSITQAERPTTRASAPGREEARLLFDPPLAHLGAARLALRADTLFFGGSGPDGLALQGGVWDFEDGTLQGWTSKDLTDIGPVFPPNDPTDRFIRRVTGPDFAGDPQSCVIHGNASVWVGAHEDEASAGCWPGGLGYGNGWGMNARKTFAYGGSGNVTIGFDYFQDSEEAFDFTYVYTVVGGIRSGPLNTSRHPNDDGFGYSGANDLFGSGIGRPDAPASESIIILPSDLPAVAGPFEILMNFDSDPLFSDALDAIGGFLNTWFGPFGFDDFTISGTALSDTDDFESSAEGWTFSHDPAIGRLVAVNDLDELGPVEDPCTCPLTSDPANDYVMTAARTSGFGFPHPKRQHEILSSNSVYVDPIAVQSTKVTVWNVWQDIPLSSGVGYRACASYYPWTCPETGTVGWTIEPAGDGGYIFTGGFGGILKCSTFIADHSEFVPAHVESLKVVWEILGDCDDLGVTDCTGPEQTNESPYWDDIVLGLTGSGVNAPSVSNDISSFQDIGAAMNSLVSTATAKMVAFYDTKRSDGNPNNAKMGDSTVVLAGTQANTQVFLNLRVYPGPGINTSGSAWVVFATDARWTINDPLAPHWAKARMDTAEAHSGPTPGKYSSYFWPNGQENRATSKILPNGLMTPGTTIEYFYSANFTASPTQQFFFPDTTGKFYLEVEVLPVYRRSTAGGPVLAPCVLYVDAFNAGAQIPIEDEGLAVRLGNQNDAAGLSRHRWDRYDYTGASTGIAAPMAREVQGDNGITKLQSYMYRTILYNTGSFATEGLRNGDADLLINWLTNDDLGRHNFQKGLWLSGDGMAWILGRTTRPRTNQLLTSFVGATLPVEDPYREQTGDSSLCVRLDPVTGRHFPGAGDSYASLRGNGCPTLLGFQVLGTVAGRGVGNLQYVDQDGGGAGTPFASVSNDKFTVGQGNYGVVLDAFSLHVMRATPNGWTGSDCGTDPSAITRRVTDVFAWMGVPPFGSALLKEPPGSGGFVGTDATEPAAGLRTSLLPNAPNPFNPRTTVRYELGARSRVTIAVFDVTGRSIRTLVDAVQDAGPYAIAWDGTQDAGEAASSGVYWVRMRTSDGFEAATQMVVLK